MVLHDYFLPTKHMADLELLAYRITASKAHPSLPNRVGNSLARCRENVDEFTARPPVPYMPGTPRRRRASKDLRIVVIGVANPDFDPQRLATLLVRQAIEREGTKDVRADDKKSA